VGGAFSVRYSGLIGLNVQFRLISFGFSTEAT
jgi:hypothetical protein